MGKEVCQVLSMAARVIHLHARRGYHDDMDTGNSGRVYILAVFSLLLASSWAQDKKFDSFGWRPMKLQRPSSILPYQSEATTTSYDSRFFDNSAPFHGSTRFYPDSPSSPFGPDSYSADSYSPDFPKSQPYHYPEDSGSYEQYGGTRDDTFNITKEKYGGFGGTGDTRGYGAYDYPKKVHDDVPQELHRHDEPKIDTSFPDLLRLGRDRFHRDRNPLHSMHPLPPPL